MQEGKLWIIAKIAELFPDGCVVDITDMFDEMQCARGRKAVPGFRNCLELWLQGAWNRCISFSLPGSSSRQFCN